MEQKSRIRANVIKEARRALKGMAFSVVVGVALAASSVKADIPEIPFVFILQGKIVRVYLPTEDLLFMQMIETTTWKIMT